MPTRLVLITHAATAATRRAAFPNDDGLDDRGRAAAESLAKRLPRSDRILTGPALAARQTATLFASAAQAGEPIADDGLRDLDVGGWAGRSLAEIGEAATAWVGDPRFAGHGGETIADCRARVGAWLAASLTFRPGVVIGVTHAAVLRAALLAVLDAPVAAFWRADASPLTILTLSSDGRRWALRALETPTEARAGN